MIHSSVETIIEIFSNPKLRDYWDELYDHGHTVEVLDKNTFISYLALKSSLLVTPRDIVLIARTKPLEDGSTIIYCRSVKHPNVPVLDTHVRGGFISYACLSFVFLFVCLCCLCCLFVFVDEVFEHFFNDCSGELVFSCLYVQPFKPGTCRVTYITACNQFSSFLIPHLVYLLISHLSSCNQQLMQLAAFLNSL